MASNNQSGFKTFQAAVTIGKGIAVTVQSDGTVTPTAGSADTGIGITDEEFAQNGYGDVRLWSSAGTFNLQVTGSAVTVGTTYAIVTNGYAGAVNGTFGPASLIALESGVASNGIVLEFALKGGLMT